MSRPDRSIHRRLFLRIAIVGVLLAVIGGGAAYLYAREDVARGVSEHAILATEALRALVVAKRDAKGGPMETLVQESLDELADRSRLRTWGAFVAVEINDRAGRLLGRAMGDGAPAAVVTDTLPSLPRADHFSDLDLPRVRLQDVVRADDKYLVPVLVTVAGSGGSTSAYVRGVYEISPEAVARLRRRTLRERRDGRPRRPDHDARDLSDRAVADVPPDSPLVSPTGCQSRVAARARQRDCQARQRHRRAQLPRHTVLGPPRREGGAGRYGDARPGQGRLPA